MKGPDINDTFRNEGPDAVRARHDRAKRHKARKKSHLAKANGLADVATDDSRPPAFSDEAIALVFAERHAADLRYVAAWSRWLRWDDTRWQFDDTLHAFDLARRVCRETAAACPKRRFVIASAKTVAATVSLARADRRLAATVDQWDADVDLFNTMD